VLVLYAQAQYLQRQEHAIASAVIETGTLLESMAPSHEVLMDGGGKATFIDQGAFEISYSTLEVPDTPKIVSS
jgi:hypothetical protein